MVSSPAPAEYGVQRDRRRHHHGARSTSASPPWAKSSRAAPCAATAPKSATNTGFPAAPAWRLGLAHLQGKVKLPEPWPRLCVAALEKPRPALRLGQALVGIATAAIDVSDGLLADLGHICERSGCAAAVKLVQLPHLPKGDTYDADLRRIALECQVAGGDDYELCFTAPGPLSLTIAQIAARLELPLWHIGEIVAGQAGEVTVYDPDFNPVSFERKGYDHFAA